MSHSARALCLALFVATLGLGIGSAYALASVLELDGPKTAAPMPATERRRQCPEDRPASPIRIDVRHELVRR